MRSIKWGIFKKCFDIIIRKVQKIISGNHLSYFGREYLWILIRNRDHANMEEIMEQKFTPIMHNIIVITAIWWDEIVFSSKDEFHFRWWILTLSRMKFAWICFNVSKLYFRKHRDFHILVHETIFGWTERIMCASNTWKWRHSGRVWTWNFFDYSFSFWWQ